MKSVCSLLCMASFLLLCAPDGIAADSISGTWRGDADALMLMHNYDPANPDYPAVKANAEALLAQVSVSFDIPAQTMDIRMGQDVFAGKYASAAEKGGVWTFTTDSGRKALFKLDKNAEGKEILYMLDTQTQQPKLAFSRAN